MNKRKAKKLRKKQEELAISFVSSYRELKRFNRAYHEFAVMAKRARKSNPDLTIEIFVESENLHE